MLLYDEIEELKELEKISSLGKEYWQCYVGRKVKHKAYGEGLIMETYVGKKDGAIMLSVEFDNVKKRKHFPFITLENGKLIGDDSIKVLIGKYEKAKEARHKLFEIVKEKKIEFKEEGGSTKARYFHRPGDGIAVSGGLPGLGRKR